MRAVRGGVHYHVECRMVAGSGSLRRCRWSWGSAVAAAYPREVEVWETVIWNVPLLSMGLA